MMVNQNRLDVLQKRNNSLKSRLVHEQLKSGNFSFHYSQKYIHRILHEYKKNRSLIKAADIVGIDYNIVIGWYINGQRTDSIYRGFYLAVNDINNSSINTENIGEISGEVSEKDFDGDYLISEYGDGWSYKTYIDGEKIFIISNDLETLKKKVKDRHLPID